MRPINVYIGYDPVESAAYHVLAHSIIRQSSIPVSISPIRRSHLTEFHKRDRTDLESTEFSMSRFLVPYLNGYRDWAVFMDCDMLFRADIAELMGLKDPKYAVQVVKHDYEPSSDVKMLGSVQSKYAKKNWTSLMVMNCWKCSLLTPEYINNASGMELHQFKWLKDDEQIGPLPLEWNWLVGEYDYNPKAKNAHFTLGGPWWKDYVTADYADEWRDELSNMLNEANSDAASADLKRGS